MNKRLWITIGLCAITTLFYVVLRKPAKSFLEQLSEVLDEMDIARMSHY